MDLALLFAELAAVPRLHGAACAHDDVRELFDRVGRPGQRTAANAALALCAGCPVLAACREWIEGLPADERPSGVVGGVFIKQPRHPRSTNGRLR